MTMTGTRRGGPRPPAPPAAPAPPEVPAAVTAALIRTLHAAISALARTGGDVGPNSTLVRLGADRGDVEVLRAFLAAQPGAEGS